MKTNFEMYQDVQDHYIVNKAWIKWGVLEQDEQKKIYDTFCIAERGIVDLRNLRDFIVAITYDGNEHAEYDKKDMGSAIVCVIDCAIAEKGGAV